MIARTSLDLQLRFLRPSKLQAAIYTHTHNHVKDADHKGDPWKKSPPIHTRPLLPFRGAIYSHKAQMPFLLHTRRVLWKSKRFQYLC